MPWVMRWKILYLTAHIVLITKNRNQSIMNRRKFLRGSSLAGLSLTSIGMASCNVSDKPDKKTEKTLEYMIKWLTEFLKKK